MAILLQRFRKQSIKRQFLFQAIILSLLLLIICLFLNSSIRKPFIDNNHAYIYETITRFNEEIQSLYEQIDILCMQMQYDGKYRKLLQSEDYHQISYTQIEEVASDTTSIAWLHNGIRDISLAGPLVRWSKIYPIQDLQQLYAEMPEQDGLHSYGIRQGSNRIQPLPPYLVFGYPLRNENDNGIGAVILSIDIHDVSFSLPSDDELDTHYLLLDVDGHFLAINSAEETSKEILEDCLLAVQHNDTERINENEDFPVRSFIGHYSIQYKFVPEVNCFIISAIDMSQLNQKLHNVTLQTIFMAVLCVLFLSVLWVVLYGNFVLPFNRLNALIVEVRKSKIRQLATPVIFHGCAEIENTSAEFSKMLNAIHDLNEEIVMASNNLYETEIQKRIAEISFLRSQINPHFLYNTLELIRSIAIEHNVPEIPTAALAMGKILRYSIKGDSMVSLAKEIEIAKAYLDIQSARFKDKLLYLFDIQPEAMSASVIKMLLQPLIENAVFYGIEPKKGRGTIMVTARRLDGCLRIVIRDDGVGIAPDVLSALRRTLKSNVYDTSRHVGVMNTHARIRLQYGKAYGLALESHEGDGTTVTLRIPAIYEGEEHV